MFFLKNRGPKLLKSLKKWKWEELFIWLYIKAVKVGAFFNDIQDVPGPFCVLCHRRTRGPGSADGTKTFCVLCSCRWTWGPGSAYSTKTFCVLCSSRRTRGPGSVDGTKTFCVLCSSRRTWGPGSADGTKCFCAVGGPKDLGPPTAQNVLCHRQTRGPFCVSRSCIGPKLTGYCLDSW